MQKMTKLNRPQSLLSDTSTTTNTRSNASLLCVGALACVLLLGACGNSGKTIVSKDRSADYRNSVVLPPLKKPSRVLQSGSFTKPSYPAVVQTAEDDTVVSADPIQAAPAATLEAVPVSQAVLDSPELSAVIINPDQGVSRLQINQGFDLAWEYLAQQLQGSDITVFSRNEAAGRIAIGCASVDESTELVRKGRWSFKRKSKSERSEHCALQARSTDQATVVSVINRSGQEVGEAEANQVFQRFYSN